MGGDTSLLEKRKHKKIGSFSLIERVILSAGAMSRGCLHYLQMPEGKEICREGLIY